MGQRQQIFITAKSKQTENENLVIGFHMQWIYGSTSVQQAKAVIEFNKNTDQYSKFSSPEGYMSDKALIDLVGNIWSTNVKMGYFHNVISLNAEAEADNTKVSPDYTDNNDGQPIIDFTCKGKPKFCYVFPFDNDLYTDPNDDDKITKTIKMFEPISAREYFEIYYSNEEVEKALNGTDKSEIQFFKRALANIKYIENNTTQMTKEEFDILHPMKD